MDGQMTHAEAVSKIAELVDDIAEKDKEITERRKCMVDVVRALGHGQFGLEHHEIAPMVASLQEQLRTSNEALAAAQARIELLTNGIQNYLDFERQADNQPTDNFTKHDKEFRKKVLLEASEYPGIDFRSSLVLQRLAKEGEKK